MSASTSKRPAAPTLPRNKNTTASPNMSATYPAIVVPSDASTPTATPTTPCAKLKCPLTEPESHRLPTENRGPLCAETEPNQAKPRQCRRISREPRLGLRHRTGCGHQGLSLARGPRLERLASQKHSGGVGPF